MNKKIESKNLISIYILKGAILTAFTFGTLSIFCCYMFLVFLRLKSKAALFHVTEYFHRVIRLLLPSPLPVSMTLSSTSTTCLLHSDPSPCAPFFPVPVEG